MRLKQTAFIWKGTNTYGIPLTGETIALSSNLAKVQLNKNGIRVNSIRKKSFQFSWFQKNITQRDIIIIFRQLSSLLTAGIPILQALTLLEQQATKPNILPLLNTLKETISSGKSFTTGLQKYPRYFNEMTCSIIHAGEASGTLNIMLNQITEQKENALQLKNNIKQALSYPILIVFVAIIASAILLIFVIPKFAELFQNTNSTLPLFTRIVIEFSELVIHFGWIVISLLFAAGIFIYHNKHNPRQQKIIDKAWLTLPLINALFKKLLLARFARNLAVLLKAGLPIMDALSIVTKTTGNCIAADAIQTLRGDIATGKQLYASMQTDAFFTPLLMQMVRVGEESGSLDTMLQKSAEFYELDLNYFIAQLNRLLEPLIMLILGVLIGSLVIAMYLPIFKLGTVI